MRNLCLLLLIAVAANAARHYQPKNESIAKSPNKIQYYYNGYFEDVTWGTIAAGKCSTVTFAYGGTAVAPPYPVYCGWTAETLPDTIVVGAQWVSAQNVVSMQLCNIGSSSVTPASMTVYCQMNNFDY